MTEALATSTHARTAAYQRFNSLPGHLTPLTERGNRTLTRRQWRRVAHKRNHAMAPFGKRVTS